MQNILRLLGAVLRTKIAIQVVFTEPKDSLHLTYLPLVYMQFMESKSTYFFHYLIFTSHVEGYPLLITAPPSDAFSLFETSLKLLNLLGAAFLIL